MKSWLRFPIFVGLIAWVFASAWAGAAPASDVTASIRAIQQASDPSAVVAAYANAEAIARNDPSVIDAYVTRMVDLGLPELAYHQAQTLTTLQSNNGLAWGVVAYVDARRGDMPEAISAINLAGQAAPQNQFVQRTAGEIIAWYDIKADKSKLPEKAEEGLTKIRGLFEKNPAFTTAYDTAKSAYEAQTRAEETPPQTSPSEAQAPSEYAPPTQPVAPSGYTAPAAPPPVYYPDYAYDWGPTWVQPAPWWWWQPVGFFGGFDFFPFSTCLVFDDDFFFHHHHHFHHDHDFFFHDRFFDHDRDDFFFHDRSFHHDGLNVAFRDPSHAFFGRNGRSSFFGTRAEPNAALARSLHANFRTGATFAGTDVGLRGTTGSRLLGSPTLHSAIPRLQPRSGTAMHQGLLINPGSTRSLSGVTQPQSRLFASRETTTMRPGTLSAPRPSTTFAPSMAPRSSLAPRGNFSMGRSFSGGTFRAPAFSAPPMAMRPSPSPGLSAGGFSRSPTFSGGLHSSPAFAGGFSRPAFGGGFHGGSLGGSFHGGGGGGFHGGGGHR